MKRLMIVWLCLLAVLLTACTPVEEPQGTSAAPETPASTEAVPETTDAPPEPEATAYQPPKHSMTAGGVSVHTDYSAYTPYQPGEWIYTRLREEPLDHFEPADDYGRVFPYAAARQFGSSEEGWNWEEGQSCGLADARGRILTDGIYVDVHLAMEYNEKTRSVENKPFWIVSQVTNLRFNTWTWEEEGETYTFPNGDILYGVISLDGSFALDCVYQSVTVAEDRLICVRDQENRQVEVYDLEGELLLTGEDFFPKPETGAWYLDKGEDFYLLTFYEQSGSRRCWFCDETGARVLGPYTSARGFREGLACVSLDEFAYGYIDKTGAWVLEPVYRASYDFWEGLAAQVNQYNQRVLIDRTGREVLQLGSISSIYRDVSGWQVTEYQDDYGVRSQSFYDDRGELIVGDDQYLYSLDRDTFWYSDYVSGETALLRPGQNLRLELDHSLSNLEIGAAEVEGRLALGYRGRWLENGVQRYYFIPQDLSACYELPAVRPISPYGGDVIRTTQDPATGETWYLCWTGTQWRGLSDGGRELRLPFRAEWPQVCGDLVFAYTEDASICTTLEGELIFRRPLDNED